MSIREIESEAQQCDISPEEREAIAQLKTLLKETQALHADDPLTEEEIAAEIDVYRQGD